MLLEEKVNDIKVVLGIQLWRWAIADKESWKTNMDERGWIMKLWY